MRGGAFLIMKNEKPYNYVYLLRWDIFLYIGCRLSWIPPEMDRYMGSGVAILDRWFENDKPEKIILSSFNTAQDARLEEARYLALLVGHKLIMNLKRTRVNFIKRGEMPSTKPFSMVQEMLLTSEKSFLSHFPDELGKLSANPLWKEGIGVHLI